MPLTAKDIDALAKVIATELRPLRQRIEALEQRPRGLRYCGVWKNDQRYEPDD